MSCSIRTGYPDQIALVHLPTGNMKLQLFKQAMSEGVFEIEDPEILGQLAEFLEKGIKTSDPNGFTTRIRSYELRLTPYGQGVGLVFSFHTAGFQIIAEIPRVHLISIKARLMELVVLV